MSNASNFSAAESALGYLFQVRVALLWSLRHLKNSNEFSVAFETLDDVVFESDEVARDVLQTKHHLRHPTDLTDASPDLWRTLRIWLEVYEKGRLAAETKLYLVTTAKCGEHSAASYLTNANRDIGAALERLGGVAQSSQNKVNQAAYRAYLGTSSNERKRLLEAVVVLDSASDVVAIDRELKDETYWAVDRDYQGDFLQRLEGWWFRRTVQQLKSTDSEAIRGVEIEAHMADIRSQFASDSLPIDEDLLDFDTDSASKILDPERIYVQQILLTDASRKRILPAVRDYYRAFNQRSRWLRSGLLDVGDMSDYERRLVEEWDLAFASITDEIGPEAAESEKQREARKVLAWAEAVSLPVRPRVIEPFVSRGSLHMLADELRIGWHPDFYERLLGLLRPAKEAL